MIDIFRTRRSIRKYEKKAIDRQSLEILKEAVLRAPSSRGINPWTFIFVDDPDVLESFQGRENTVRIFSRVQRSVSLSAVTRLVRRMDRGLYDRSHRVTFYRALLRAWKLLESDEKQAPFQ